MFRLRRAVSGRGRGLWLAGLVAVVLVAIVAIVLFQGGGSSGLGGTSVAGAAERTAAEPGGSIETEITYAVSGGSQPVTATGVGVFDSTSGRARLELTVPGADGSPLKVESVGDETTSFVRSRVLSEELPPGKEWLGMEPLLGNDPTTALNAGGGAKGSLEMLRGVGGDVERVGEESVRGEEAIRYKGTVDLSQAAKKSAAEGNAGLARLTKQIAGRLSGPMPVEVWIGVGGLVRRERLIERIPTDGHTLELDTEIEFFDFAPHPDIALPPSAKVLDYTPVLRAELGMMDGTSLGSLEPPAGASPLSVGAFRRSAVAACRAGNGKLAEFIANEPPFQKEANALGRSLGADAGRSQAAKRLTNAIGLWIERIHALAAQLTSRLGDLAPPARYAADFHRYLTIDAEQAEYALARARAYQLGVAKISGLDHKAEEADQERALKRLAARMGISACEQAAPAPAPSA